MTGDEQKATLDEMDRRLRKIEEAEEGPKDLWDKLDAASGLIGGAASLLAGLLIAGIGFYATNIYNARAKDAEEQQRNRATIATELQTVEKFLPHLTSNNEQTKEAAILAISSLGNTELATKLAVLIRGPGARSALTTIATASPVGSQTRTTVEVALADLLKQYSSSVAYIYVGFTSQTGHLGRAAGTGFIVSSRGYLLTASYLFQKDALPDSFDIRVHLKSKSTPPLRAKLITKQDDVGFALLKLDTRFDAPGIVLAPAKELDRLEKVTVLGFTAADSIEGQMAVAGSVVGDGPDGKLLLDVAANPGFGGSPVFDTNGQVVAMISGSLSGLIGATPIRFARPLLMMAGVQ